MAYSKQTWVTGETITASKLNHMEDGIATAQSTADGAAASVAALGAAGAIGTSNLANASVTNAKLDQEAVDSDNIRTGAVITPLIYDGAVTLPKLGADVIAELENKATIDGYYESMTVGNAEQLISSVGITDQTPYNFRTSGGSADIGDREELNAVVGVSVSWNQLVQNGNFDGTSNWFASNPSYISMSASNNVLSVTTSANGDYRIYQGASFIKDHYYLISADIKGTANTYCMYVYLGSGTVYVAFYATDANWHRHCTIKKAVAGTVQQIRLQNGIANTTNEYKNVNIIDLTALLGSTIADYIYALEQSNVGTGVAWFRKYFPKLFYGYSAPTMLSVKTSAHKMVGFNQWDEEWELGYYNVDTGASSASNSNIRCKNKIKVVPNTTYYIKAPNTLWILEYDADDIYLNKYTSKMNQVFTTSANTQYIRFYAVNSYGTTYNHDICINLHWDGERDGEYEPYVEHVYPLDDSLTLRGIPKLDASNNLYADGDRYLPDGTVIRKRRQIVADGNTVKATSVNQSNGTYYCVLTALSSANKAVNSTTTETRIITDKGYRDYAGVGVGHIYITGNGLTPVICLFDQTLTTVSAVNAYLASNPITIEYELATPTTETADPYQQTQIVDDFGTEEFVDAAVESGERDVEIPVGNETVYKPNLRAKLEMAPDSPDGDGDYIVRQTNGQNAYIPLVEVKELPDMPSEDGSYKLRCTVTNGTATLSWVSDS